MYPRALLLMVFVVALGSPLKGLAADTVASLDFGQILAAAPQIKTSRKAIKQEFVPLEKKMQVQQKRVQSLRKSLRRMTPSTSSLKRASLVQQYGKAHKELASEEKQYRARLRSRLAKARSSFTQMLAGVVGQYARQHGLAVVLKGGVAFTDSSLDITDEILSLLREKYQAAQSEAKSR